VKRQKIPLKFVENEKVTIFATYNTTFMKRVLAFVLLVLIFASCSQYTCPTYSKKEVKQAPAKRI
jgi:hypothetical protein